MYLLILTFCNFCSVSIASSTEEEISTSSDPDSQEISPVPIEAGLISKDDFIRSVIQSTEIPEEEATVVTDESVVSFSQDNHAQTLLKAIFTGPTALQSFLEYCIEKDFYVNLMCDEESILQYFNIYFSSLKQISGVGVDSYQANCCPINSEEVRSLSQRFLRAISGSPYTGVGTVLESASVLIRFKTFPNSLSALYRYFGYFEKHLIPTALESNDFMVFKALNNRDLISNLGGSIEDSIKDWRNPLLGGNTVFDIVYALLMNRVPVRNPKTAEEAEIMIFVYLLLQDLVYLPLEWVGCPDGQPLKSCHLLNQGPSEARSFVVSLLVKEYKKILNLLTTDITGFYYDYGILLSSIFKGNNSATGSSVKSFSIHNFPSTVDYSRCIMHFVYGQTDAKLMLDDFTENTIWDEMIQDLGDTQFSEAVSEYKDNSHLMPLGVVSALYRTRKFWFFHDYVVFRELCEKNNINFEPHKKPTLRELDYQCLYFIGNCVEPGRVEDCVNGLVPYITEWNIHWMKANYDKEVETNETTEQPQGDIVKSYLDLHLCSFVDDQFLDRIYWLHLKDVVGPETFFNKYLQLTKELFSPYAKSSVFDLNGYFQLLDQQLQEFQRENMDIGSQLISVHHIQSMVLQDPTTKFKASLRLPVPIPAFKKPAKAKRGLGKESEIKGKSMTEVPRKYETEGLYSHDVHAMWIGFLLILIGSLVFIGLYYQ